MSTTPEDAVYDALRAAVETRSRTSSAHHVPGLRHLASVTAAEVVRRSVLASESLSKGEKT